MISEEPRVEALRRPDQPRRMLVIVNPVATKMSDRLRGLVVYALQGRYDVTVADTTGRGHATELCREAAAEDYDVVVAFGGDGTVNEAANGLAGSQTALTCLPGGSNNVVAKLLGIPTDVVDATEHLLLMADRWEPRTVDLGMVNERTVHVRRRAWASTPRGRARGRPPAAEGPLRRRTTSSRRRSPRSCAVHRPPAALEVEVAGRTIPGVSVFIQNARALHVLQGAPGRSRGRRALDSGDLAGVVLTRARPYDVPTVTFRALSGAERIAKHRGIEAFAQARARRALHRRPHAARPGRRRPHPGRARGALLRVARRPAGGEQPAPWSTGWPAVSGPGPRG